MPAEKKQNHYHNLMVNRAGYHLHRWDRRSYDAQKSSTREACKEKIELDPKIKPVAPHWRLAQWMMKIHQFLQIYSCLKDKTQTSLRQHHRCLPHDLIFFNRIQWSTVSKAALKSNKIRTAPFPESTDNKISLVTLNRADSVL